MGITRITLFLALGAALSAAKPAPDPLEKPKPKAEAGATVTVTAEATSVEIAKTPNAVVVVDRMELDRLAPRSAAELIESLLPGQLLSYGGVGTGASFFPAGARSQDVVITLDGLRVQDPMGLGVDLSGLDLVGIDRVEIQRGGVSARQGANAMGGVVALYSGNPAPAGVSGSASLAAGTQGILRGSLAPAYGWGSGWVRLGVASSREDQVIETEAPYRVVGTALNLGQSIGESTLVTAHYRNTYAGVPTPFASSSYAITPRAPGAFNPRRENHSRLELFGATVRSQFTDTLLGELNAGGWEQQRLTPDWMTGLPTQAYNSRGNQATGTLSWSPSVIGGMSGTADFSREWGTSPGNITRNVGEGRHLALALDAFLEPLRDLRFTLAVRTQKDRLQVHPEGMASGERNSSAVVGKLGLNWTLGAGFRLYGSHGNSSAHPTLFQVMYNLNNLGQDLKNEKGKTTQAGASWKSGPWSARLDLSRTQYDSLVAFDPTLGVPSPWGGMSGAYINGQNIRVQSMELGLGYRLQGWGIEGFYRNQEARDLSVPEVQQLMTSTVVRRPFQTVGASAYAVFGALRIDGRWSWFGSRYEYGLPFAYKAHFNDASLAASYPFTKQFSLSLRGEHLFQSAITREEWLDRSRDFENDAAMIYGYPAQPRTVTLEARYRF